MGNETLYKILHALLKTLACYSFMDSTHSRTVTSCDSNSFNSYRHTKLTDLLPNQLTN